MLKKSSKQYKITSNLKLFLSFYLLLLFLFITISSNIIVRAAGTPTLMFPSDGLYWNNNEPGFIWYATAASTYHLQLATDIGFTSLVIDDSDCGDVTGMFATYHPSIVVSDGTYYWHVRGYEGSWSSWSASWVLHIDTVAPEEAPILLSPLNGIKVNDSTPSLNWTNTVEAGEHYVLQIAEDIGMTTLEVNMQISESYILNTPTLPDGDHYWRVCGEDLATNKGPWSNIWNLTVDTTPPDAPTLVYLPDNASINFKSIDLEWFPVQDAVQYNYQLDQSNSFSSPSINATTTNTMVNAFLDTTGDWYWRVRAKDDVDNWGSWSTRHFIIDTIAPIEPTLISPIDGSSTNDIYTFFEWDNILDAIEYQIQIDTSDTFTSLIINATTTYTNYTSLTAFSDGPYFWRVRAKDEAENWGNWCLSRSFIIDTIGPETPNLISPSHGSTIDDNTPILAWDPITDAVEYEIIVDDEINFLNPNIFTTTANAFYIVITPLNNDLYYWKVRAKDEVGNWGNWCVVHIFTVDALVVPEYHRLNSWVIFMVLPIAYILVKLRRKTRKK